MRLTLRARILAVFLVALVAFMGTLAFGLAQVRGIGEELSRVQDLWLPLSREVTELRFRKFPSWDADALAKQSPRTRRVYGDTLRVLFSKFQGELAAIQRDATASLQAAEGESEARMSKVVTKLGALTDPSREAARAMEEYLLALDGTDAVVIEQKKTALSSSTRYVLELIEAAETAVDDGLRADAKAAQTKAKSSLLALALLTAVTAAFGLVAIGLVGRALRPVGDLIGGVKRISAGEFDHRIQLRSGAAEIATLANEFNQMAQSLRSRDERLRRLSAYNENVLESVRVGILVADEAGTILGMNRAAEDIWGVTRAELGGKPVKLLEAAAGKEGAAIVERVESVRAGAAAVRLAAVAFPNGRMVEVSAVPFVEDGRAAGVVVVAEDVTERVAVEQALLRSERLAAIGKLSSQITHEVRNPLNSLSLNVEMLEEELAGKDGEAKTLLGAIAGEIERLTQITEGYLDFARLPRPRLERAPLNSLVDSLLRFVREEAQKSDVRVVSELASELPEVLADENQLRQALLNIVRNAVEAMRASNGSGNKHGGTLTVATRRAGEHVEITVRDDGPGISPKDLARIFDPFFSTKSEGTGLGLPLTQQIIEEHGGTIACASEPGRGTIFTIRLPAADGPV